MEECLDYVLILHLPIVGEIGWANLNADEVVEYAHEYGINVDYNVLPTAPGSVVAGRDYEVQWPTKDGRVGDVVR